VSVIDGVLLEKDVRIPSSEIAKKLKIDKKGLYAIKTK